MKFLIYLGLISICNAFTTLKYPTTVKNNFKMMNPLPGSDIGIPLNIFQNVYTNLHYGYDITSLKNIFLQFSLGYYTYGYDRYQDAIEYSLKKYDTSKKKLYDYIIENKNFVKSSLDLTFAATVFILISDENFLINLPFIFLLVITDNYKQIKKDIGVYKSLFISTLWTACTIFLPCVLHDHDYSIISSPMDYLPCTLTLFGLSNVLDIKDVDEDIENGINTIPVVFGKYNASYISLLCLSLSSLLFGLNQHYLDRPIINSFNELQNAGMAIIPYMMLKNETLDSN
tara:strand:- start:927 stop:1784 length:858 start_codon:yes stop_codon:yes gene_type:complete